MPPSSLLLEKAIFFLAYCIIDCMRVFIDGYDIDSVRKYALEERLNNSEG